MKKGKRYQEAEKLVDRKKLYSAKEALETIEKMPKTKERCMYHKKLESDIRCPLEYGLEVFGGKWKSRVICVLADKKTLRYSELRAELVNITDAVLSTTLKALIADDIVSRKSYDEIPPRVEYSLTEKGLSVMPILQSICDWSCAFYKKETDKETSQCMKCDHK